MNSTQRLRAMVEHKPVDRVGISGWMHMPLVDRVTKDFVRSTVEFAESNHWDLIKVMYNGLFFTEDFGNIIDFPTTITGPNIMRKFAVEHPEEFRNLKVCDPKKGALAREVEGTKRIIEHFKGTVPVLATTFTSLSWAKEMYCYGYPSTGSKMRKLMEYSPSALHKGLEIITETQVLFMEELVKAGIDGIFLATHFASSDDITAEQHAEFSRKYDLQVLEAIQKDTWFNMMHVHGYKNLMLKEFDTYPVQALNWEDVGSFGPKDEYQDLAQVRAFSDKVLIGGIDQYHDLNNAQNDREAVKALIKQRYLDAVAQVPDKRLIFAPGCAFANDTPLYLCGLLHEVVEEATGIA